jgi:tRNA threonylcarbamoyl adenosine modification protein (Sua5/YciO/YrdC/YwlC family)
MFGTQPTPTPRERTLFAEILKLSPQGPEAHHIQYAASLIVRGQVVGVPTDTFYGLAADPFNLAAVESVYRLKGRPEQKALPLLVASVEQAVPLIRDLPDNFVRLAQRFWPGALTIVVNASHRIPLKVTGNTGRIALRQPNSKIATALIEACGTAITGTSANISGFPACSSVEQLVKQMGDRLPLILDGGETGATLASTIVDLHEEQWRILREGVVAEKDIRKLLEE